MNKLSINLQRVAHFLISLVLIVFILIVARDILAPLAFAALFAFLLKPICAFFERFIDSRLVAVLLSFIATLIPILLIMTFFVFQIANVIGDLSVLINKLSDGLYDAVLWIGRNMGLNREETQNWMAENFTAVLDAPLALLTESLSSSTAIFTGALLCIVYTFFFLLYRHAFKGFMLAQFKPETREKIVILIHQIQYVSQKYFYGMLLVMIILGVLNSLGLFLIGVKYAFFWGFLGALLAIIPYVGTFLGGAFPFIYVLATGTTVWQPIAVALMYIFIQSIEGNLITPKVVGNTVKINPLAAILALIAGGAVWGIPGLILALPFVATLRIIFSYFDILKPLGELMGVNIFEKANVFTDVYDQDRYRLITFFQRGRRQDRQ